MRARSMRLILASASPRRRELLAQAGYSFTVEAADVDETRRQGEEAAAYVLRLAEEKARAVLGRALLAESPPHDDKAAIHGAPGVAGPLVVLGADTCVVCEGEILGKPVDSADAMRMLRMLSGRAHRVLTGVAVATRAGVVNGVESTAVTFAEIPEGELAAYCATKEPMDKAGAYGIQGYAARWVPRIEGCYFNVMGLPIARVVGMLDGQPAIVDG